MPFLDAADEFIRLSNERYTAIDEARWRPSYNRTLRRFMCSGQQPGESLLQYYCQQDVCYMPLTRKGAGCVAFEDSSIIGISGVRRDIVIILACPTACIIVCVPSRYGREDDILSVEARVEAEQEAHMYVDRLADLIAECREMSASNFSDPAVMGCVVFGEWDPANRGRVETIVQQIMLDGMARLGITHYDQLQHLETNGDMDDRPGLGSIVVMSPGIASNDMPHIVVDDEVEWAITPADVPIPSVERDEDEENQPLTN